MSVNIKIENAQKRYGDNIIIGINDIDKMEKDIWIFCSQTGLK